MNKYIPHTVFVLRGAAGSGKSTLAQQFINSRLCKYWVETDKFFYTDGVYNFDPSKLGVNHMKAFTYFRECLNMNDGNIVVSNTNIFKKHYEEYVNHARANKFNVTELILNQQFENIHGVPPQKVAQMRRNFEY